MISFDALKKLHASALEPICADRPENRRSFRRKIVIKIDVTKFPHKEVWSCHGMPYPCPVLNHANCRCEVVGPTAQSLELRAGCAEIRRLVKPQAIADEDLVGADDKGSIMAARYAACFYLGKRKRTLDRSTAHGPKGLLDRLFVYRGGFDPDLHTGGREQPRPRRTG